MYKKKKKERTMIDMRARLNIKIIPGTAKESSDLQKELDEINIIVEKRMQLYEEHLRTHIMSVMSEEIIVSNRDVDYFINTYQKMIENRNIDNIKNRMKQYHAYLTESQNEN